jgi:hypothetical protein
MTFVLDVENPPGVLSEVETPRCAPLNQCYMKSCYDGISMIIATIPFMYQVDYYKLQLSHPAQMNFVIICGLGFKFVFFILILLGYIYIFHSVFFDISL